MTFDQAQFEIGRLLGELQAHMRMQSEELGRQTDILHQIQSTLRDLPRSLQTSSASLATSMPPDHDWNNLKAIVPILKALLPLATLAMLAAGRITWSDIPVIIGLGNP
jgi:hypothetical protein